MKVLLLVKSVHSDEGGVARSVLGLKKHLRSIGFDVDVSAGESRREIQRKIERSDIVHCNGLWSPCIHNAVITARHAGIPVIISARGMLEPWPLKTKWLKKKLAWLLYQGRDLDCASAIHATSVQEKENLLSLGIRPDIHVIPNGVEMVDEAGIRDFSERKNIVLFLSRVHKKKGIEELLKAWAEVSTPQWKLRIVGGGEKQYVSRLKNMATTLCE